MKNRRIPLYIDLVFCCIVIPLMITVLPIERWMHWNSEFVYILIGWLYTVYFIIRYYCIPSLFKSTKRKILAIFIIILTIIGTYIIARYKMVLPPRPGRELFPMMKFAKKGPERFHMHQQAAWFMYLVVSSFSVATGLLSELFKQIVYRQELEYEKNKAELAIYKAQINPHFLFNTLNTLYGLMISNTERAEKAFMEFIDMMRYMYTDCIKDFVSIDSEIEYIEKYINLQKNRLNEHTKVFFSYENDRHSSNLKIAPMILMTFVENALKYGTSSHIDNSVYIAIKIEDSNLLFTTQNSIFIDKNNNKPKGVGITNCRKRLELLYTDKYTLYINNDDSEFVVTLTIKLGKG